MEIHEKEIQTIKCLYQSMRIPLRLLRNGKVLYSLPETIETAASVTGNSGFLPLPGNETGKAQYVLSAAGERFIILLLADGDQLTAGPFLSEKMTDDFIARLVREGKIKIRMKPALKTFYDTLEIMPMQRYYYTGVLLEMLFSTIREIPADHSGKTEQMYEFIPDSFYLQSRDYRTRQFMHSPYMTEQEICHYISAGDKEGALHILAEINRRPRAQLAGTEIRSLKNSMICSCAFMTRAAISGGVSADDAFTLSDAYIRQIESFRDIDTILHFEEKMVVGFTSAVTKLKKEHYSEIINRAVDFIENHLCEKLTLEMIAEAVFLNPNYFSGLFRQETGETVHGYIIRRRVEESGFFVRSGTEPIADIASFYQFSSQSHYVRSFKKIMGVTPGAYRKRPADRPLEITG